MVVENARLLALPHVQTQTATAICVYRVGMLGDDWPPYSPLKLERKVEMVVEESVHYVAGGGEGGGPGSGSGGNLKDEWQYQRGFGFDGAARLGADNRTFAVSLYHQEHCLLYFHAQLTDRTKDDDDSGAPGAGGPSRSAHHQHCLNYLRQKALCHPDLTLEPGDFAATRDFEVDRVGETHVCRDFDTAWDYNTEGWLEWYQFLKDSRIPSESLSLYSLIAAPLTWLCCSDAESRV
jgi:Mycotoxin biosynthesis protein UstYa